MLKILWDKFKKVAYRIAVVQTIIILAFIYYVIALPYGIMMRIFSDRLQLKRNKVKKTNWLDVVDDIVERQELENSTTKGY